MSTGLYVFLKELPDTSVVRKSLKALKLPTSLSSDFDLATHPGGFVASTWNTVPIGIELWRLSTNTITNEVAEDRGIFSCLFHPEVEERRVVIHMPSKCWRTECCAYGLCAALRHGCDSRVYDTRTSCYLNVEDLMAEVNNLTQRNESRIYPCEVDEYGRIDW